MMRGKYLTITQTTDHNLLAWLPQLVEHIKTMTAALQWESVVWRSVTQYRGCKMWSNTLRLSCQISERDTCWHLARHTHKLLSPHTNVKHPSSWAHSKGTRREHTAMMPYCHLLLQQTLEAELHGGFAIQQCPLVVQYVYSCHWCVVTVLTWYSTKKNEIVRDLPLSLYSFRQVFYETHHVEASPQVARHTFVSFYLLTVIRWVCCPV